MDGMVLPPGGGELSPGALNVTLEAAMSNHMSTSSFQLVVPPHSDVGAHVHTRGEEVFFVLEGQLDLLAF